MWNTSGLATARFVPRRRQWATRVWRKGKQRVCGVRSPPHTSVTTRNRRRLPTAFKYVCPRSKTLHVAVSTFRTGRRRRVLRVASITVPECGAVCFCLASRYLFFYLFVVFVTGTPRSSIYFLRFRDVFVYIPARHSLIRVLVLLFIFFSSRPIL